jgi:YegS/Rv2252/BmrU family lipid kinase
LDRFLHIIINQQSRNSDAVFKKLLLELPNYTKNYEIHITDNIEQLDKMIKQLKTKIAPNDLVVTVGGDGSLNQTVTFFEKYQLENDIGYIPSGSGNDFARTHNIPVKTEAAIAHLFKIKKPKELSIIHGTQGEKEHYAVNSLGLGIDGLVNHMINANLQKKSMGRSSYIMGVLSAFGKQNKFPITLKVDDGVYTFDHVQLALVSNNPYFGGGIKIVPEADGSDDFLEVVIANDASLSNLLNILPRILMNQSHLNHPKLHYFKTKEVALFTESEQYAQKDGEVFKQKGFAYTFTTKKRSFWI